MKKVVYKKLIRDKIPEIIKQSGWTPVVSVLNQKRFLQELKKKLLEEAKELLAAKSKDEIAGELIDLQEIIDTLAAEFGFSKSDLKKKQSAKRRARGGFKKKLFLIREEKK